MTDFELLQLYVTEGSDKAFHDLFDRHRDMVYGVCLRMLGDPTQAEEALQAVFLVLADKARTLSPKVILPGWLCRTAVYASKHQRRTELRRQKHERKAAEMRSRQPIPDKQAWTAMRPVLDEALTSLSSRYRDAIVLHYFKDMSQKEAARRAGCRPKAFQKRVSRALALLRSKLARRGIVLSVTVLGTCLAENAVAATVSIGLSASSSSAVLAQSVAKTMLWVKVKIAALWMAAASVVIGTAAPVVVSAVTDAPPAHIRIINGLNHDRDQELFTWTDGVNAEIISSHVTEGRGAAKIMFPARGAAGIPGGFRIGGPLTAGWEAWEEFAFDIFNPDDHALVIEIQMDDSRTDPGDYRTRHTAFYQVMQGSSTIVIDLAALTANNGRSFDVSNLKAVSFRAASAESVTIICDNFRLMRRPEGESE